MSWSGWKWKPVLAAILFFSITLLPGGVGNVGRKGGTAGGKNSPGFVEMSFGQTVSEATDPNEPLATVAANLAAKINLLPAYSASVVTDPGDPNANSILVTKSNGGEVSRLSVRASDDNIKDIGVVFPTGHPVMFLGHPEDLNNDGTFRLVIERTTGPDFDVTYDTSVFPNTTPQGLMGHIVDDLNAAGYGAQSSSKKVTIKSPSNQMTAGRIYATDTGAAVTEIGLGPVGQGIPTLSHVFMFLLIACLTSAAIFMLRRTTTST